MCMYLTTFFNRWLINAKNDNYSNTWIYKSASNEMQDCPKRICSGILNGI